MADFIGKTLAGKEVSVDVKPVNKVKDLVGYKAAVIGSAIQAGDVLPEITKFVKTHKAELERIPISYFIVCMLLKDNTEKNQKKAYGYLDSLSKEIKPIDTGLFAGKLDYSKLGTFDYIIVKYFVGTPEGDYRDWEAIRTWANDLLHKLKLN